MRPRPSSVSWNSACSPHSTLTEAGKSSSGLPNSAAVAEMQSARNALQGEGSSVIRLEARFTVGHDHHHRMRDDLFGGPEGNEILTSAVAVVLIGLLIAEGVTVVHMDGLV